MLIEMIGSIGTLAAIVAAIATACSAFHLGRDRAMKIRLYAPSFWIERCEHFRDDWYVLDIAVKHGEYPITFRKIKSNALVLIHDKHLNFHRGNSEQAGFPQSGKSSLEFELPLLARRDISGKSDVSFRLLVKLKKSQRTLRLSIHSSDWIFDERYQLKLAIANNMV